jgi:hypothetical protein
MLLGESLLYDGTVEWVWVWVWAEIWWNPRPINECIHHIHLRRIAIISTYSLQQPYVRGQSVLDREDREVGSLYRW